MVGTSIGRSACLRVLLLCLPLWISSAADEHQTTAPHPAASIFAAVHKGLMSGEVTLFGRSLAPQVYISLRTGEHGTFSTNQASVLLEYFLRTRKLSNLVFSTIGESATTPYATGSATLLHRGSRQLVQVYVAVARTGDQWLITQLNIY